MFNEEQKFPEMDAYLISKLYTDWTTAGGAVDNTVLTAANILSRFDAWMQDMDDANVPVDGRILYVTPAVDTLIKTAISRQYANGDAAIRRAVDAIDNVKKEMVPTKLMKTAYDFTTGYAVAKDAVQINMLLVHPSAVITPEKYCFAQLDAPAPAPRANTCTSRNPMTMCSS